MTIGPIKSPDIDRFNRPLKVSIDLIDPHQKTTK